MSTPDSPPTDVMLADDNTQNLGPVGNARRFVDRGVAKRAAAAGAGAILAGRSGRRAADVAAELIKVDLEYRWQQHSLPKTIEEYLAEFPELAAGGEVALRFDLRRISDPPAPARRPGGGRLSPAAFRAERSGSSGCSICKQSSAATTTLAVGARRPPLDVGQQIDDFDILVRLGEGAFASVFLARQRSMQRLVALKVSRDHGSESQTLAQLDHPGIVRVYDQRILPAQRLRLMYMQHVPGRHAARRAAEIASRAGRPAQRQDDARRDRRSARA